MPNIVPSQLPSLSPAQVNMAESEQWKQIIRQALSDTRCATPAFLTEDFDTTEETVTVQIAIQERVRTVQGAKWYDIPPITHVPVVLPRGGGFSITVPLKKGDEGLLVFCDTCFDYWWKYGATGPKADNVSSASGSQRQLEVRRHYVHDCGFIPGMSSQPNKLGDYSTTALQVRKDDGSIIIELNDNNVLVKGTGTPLALMNDNFFSWYRDNVQPFLVSKGYAGPGIPANPETTIFKAE